MKVCKDCKVTKELNCFHKHKKMADGYLNICKSCCYEKQKARRLTPEGKKARKKERKKYKESGKYKEAQKKYDATQKGKEKNRRYEAKRYQGVKGKARQAARNAVKYAVKVGKLIKEPCIVCGDLDVHGHHPSYAKDMRLKVVWLCHLHHNEIHNPKGD
jgi:hypothetical protein